MIRKVVFLNFLQGFFCILKDIKNDILIPFHINPQHFDYVNITTAINEIRIKCSYCNVDRCKPLTFCYSIKYSSKSRSVGDYCANDNEMFSLVGAQLDATTSSHGRKRRRLHESCLPSINDPTISYCVCYTLLDNDASREYEDLRRIRLWRYQSLLFYNEVQNRKNAFFVISTFFTQIITIFYILFIKIY